MAANVLVVAKQTAGSRDLIAAIAERAQRGPIEVTLLMPCTGPGLGARGAMREQLDAALETWRAAGIEAKGIVGDGNPVDAVAEVWDPRRDDELIVSTLPGQSSRWLRSDLPQRLRKLTGAPVKHIVATDMRPEPNVTRAEAPETSPLGPLAVLSWGGRGSGER
jgi:hypothetical protein